MTARLKVEQTGIRKLQKLLFVDKIRFLKNAPLIVFTGIYYLPKPKGSKYSLCFSF